MDTMNTLLAGKARRVASGLLGLALLGLSACAIRPIPYPPWAMPLANVAARGPGGYLCRPSRGRNRCRRRHSQLPRSRGRQPHRCGSGASDRS